MEYMIKINAHYTNKQKIIGSIAHFLAAEKLINQKAKTDKDLYMRLFNEIAYTRLGDTDDEDESVDCRDQESQWKKEGVKGYIDGNDGHQYLFTESEVDLLKKI